MLIETVRGLEIIKVLKYLLLFCFQPVQEVSTESKFKDLFVKRF